MEIFRKTFAQGEFIIFNETPKLNLKKVKQVHGTKIVSTGELEADGLITTVDNLAILTADCMPVLLLGEKGSALIHAGWQGLQAGILKNDILNSLKIFKAFIGPHIGSCCYEVTEEFLEKFPKESFIVKNNKFYFSLKDVAMLHMRQFFGDIKIESAHECTSCNPNFHSYRRDQTVKRNFNVWKPNIVDTIHTSR